MGLQFGGSGSAQPLLLPDEEVPGASDHVPDFSRDEEAEDDMPNEAEVQETRLAEFAKGMQSRPSAEAPASGNGSGPALGMGRAADPFNDVKLNEYE